MSDDLNQTTGTGTGNTAYNADGSVRAAGNVAPEFLDEKKAANPPFSFGAPNTPQSVTPETQAYTFGIPVAQSQIEKPIVPIAPLLPITPPVPEPLAEIPIPAFDLSALSFEKKVAPSATLAPIKKELVPAPIMPVVKEIPSQTPVTPPASSPELSLMPKLEKTVDTTPVEPEIRESRNEILNLEKLLSDEPVHTATPATPTPPLAPKQDTLTLNTEEKKRPSMQELVASVALPERRTERGIADAKAPEPLPAKEISTLPPEAPEKKPVQETIASPAASTITALHTLKDDIRDSVRINKLSLVRAASLDQDREIKSSLRVEQPAKRSTTFMLVFFSFLFIVLGGAALLGVFVVESAKSAPKASVYDDSLVFAEQSDAIDVTTLSAPALKLRLAAVRDASTMSLGAIQRIIPTIRDIAPDGTEAPRGTTGAELLQSLGTRAPDELLRSLGETVFMGIHTVDKNAPVLVFTVGSYDHAFAGMLAWEPSLARDLAPFFRPIADMKQGADGTPVKRNFEDMVMRNYDVRAIKDDQGQVVLYYSFPNPHLLVIAESPFSFTEILSRLQSGRRL